MDETIEYKGYTIKIAQDENPESPREWDNFGKMVCFHKRYNLPMEFAGLDSENYSSWEEMKKYLIKEGAVVILPIFMYDHSGITIKTSPYGDSWDSGQVGFIYATKEDILKEYSITKITTGIKEKVEARLKGEVETYDQFLTGDVYGFEIEGTDESCCGFYGQEGAVMDAKATIDDLVLTEARKKAEKTKRYIQSHVPIGYRHA